MAHTKSLADGEDNWEEAKKDLVAFAKEASFPFFIVTDDVAFVCKDFDTYLRECHEDGTLDADETATHLDTSRQWWENYATEVSDMEEALRVAYPWFHDGESAPEA